MKICKKILAGVLVFAMMMNMCTFVFAGETEATTLLWGANFNNIATGDVRKSGEYYPAVEGKYIDGSQTYNRLFLKNGSSNQVNTTTVVLDSSDNTNKYIYTSHNQLGYNVNKNSSDFTDFGYAINGNSVYSTSYDIMIPEKTTTGADNTGYKNRRYAAIVFGTTGASYSEMAGCAYVNIYDGKISGYATKGTATNSANITKKYSKEIDYKYGTWVKLRIDCWIVENKARVAVYADNELIYVGDRDDVTVSGMAAGTAEFRYANIANGTTLASWPPKNATTDNQSYTYYDNFKISLLPSSNKVTDDDITTQVELDEKEALAKTPQVTLHSYPADSISSYISDKSGSPVFVDKGTLGRKDVLHGSATDVLSKDAFKAVNNSYTNITSSSYKYLVVNSYQSFSKYVQKDAKNTFVYSVDLNFEDFNAQMRNTFSLGIEGQKTSDVLGSFTVDKNGNIEFKSNAVNKGKVVEGKSRTESRVVTPGDWINVKMVFEIEYGETQYAIKMFGIYEDAVIYENEFTLGHNESVDGYGISIDQISFGIGNNDTPHSETVTGVKNIYFEKNNNFDWSTVDTDNWIDRTVSLELDTDGNIDVEAKKGGFESFPNGSVLLVALYDENGALIKLLDSKTLTDGSFVYEVPAVKVAIAKTIKGFVFDSITSAKPLIKHGEIVIGNADN